jgi:hypothetical protein
MTQTVEGQHDYDAGMTFTALAKRIAELERQVAELKSAQPEERLRQALTRPANHHKRGRPPKYPFYIASLRDDLIRFLEEYWPELQMFFSVPSRPENIRLSVQRIFERPERIPGDLFHDSAQHLLQNFDVLIQVLASDRFRGDPRQVANAMAGVPGVSWWRSLKVCGEIPCRISRGERALRDYIRRKHIRLYDELASSNSDPIRVTSTLRRYPSKDPLILAMRSHTDYALRIWAAGETDISRLR